MLKIELWYGFKAEDLLKIRWRKRPNKSEADVFVKKDKTGFYLHDELLEMEWEEKQRMITLLEWNEISRKLNRK